MPRPVEHPCNFDPVAHVYRDHHGRAWRSVTQTLGDAGLTDFSMVDPVVLAAAQERGSRVHEFSALWDRWRRSIALPAFFTQFAVAEHLRGYLWQYNLFLEETGFIAIDAETERPRLVEVHGRLLGMTPDRVGYFPNNRRLVILDLKTGLSLISHPLQIAGYSLGVERVLRLAMMHERVALYLQPESYRLQSFPHQQDYHAFLDAMDGGGQYLDQWTSLRKGKLIA